MLKLIIGNKAYSSWSLRGWLAVKQSGLPFEEVVAPLYDDAWEDRKRQPDLAPGAGRVPTLWDGDFVIWDSLAILLHLDAKTGGTRFWPADPAAHALALSMVAEMHSGYLPLRREHPMNVRKSYPTLPDGEVLANLDRIADLWGRARELASGDEPYLFGAFGAADIAFAPVASRITTYHLPVPPAARAYVDALMAHPWMREWIDAGHAEDWVLPQYER